MFDSGIAAKDLIAGIKTETDVALPIPNAMYVMWLNELEQMLYGGVIREQGMAEKTFIRLLVDPKITEERLKFTEEPLAATDKRNAIRFEDITAVYADDLQLIKTTRVGAQAFIECYYKLDGALGVNCYDSTMSIKIFFYERPPLKTVNGEDEIQAGNVMVPIEFIEMVKSKLRAEAYMIENEYVHAGNQISLYNQQLDMFKSWLQTVSPKFGQ